MSKSKCCGNCKHFNNEDVEGWGWCSFNKTKTHCAQSWDCHNDTFNGWTEITQDNEGEVYNVPPERLVIAKSIVGKVSYQHYYNIYMTIATMAKSGGYYYYELPELKLE